MKEIWQKPGEKSQISKGNFLCIFSLRTEIETHKNDTKIFRTKYTKQIKNNNCSVFNFIISNTHDQKKQKQKKSKL